jgi:putative peptidoglycan lipid II flippase
VNGGRFARESGTMALGTTLSRLTGLLRLVALVYAVHFRTLADAYNLANTLPNVVHDVVLGGIVSATFVPVFVAELSRSGDRAARQAISAVTSVAVLVVLGASVAFLVASPFIVDAMTAFNHAPQAAAERSVASDLLVLFVPQLACYGCISIGTALLNARRRFAAPAFVPIANNLVLVVVLVAFGLWVRHPSLGGVYHHRNQLLLLGLGTTAGVVVQLLWLLPALRRARLGLRWAPRLRHPAVRRVLALSGWTVGLVVANQVALLVVLALSVHVGPGAVTAYTYAYTFFQLPYGVVAVSVMTVVAPALAGAWATGDMARFRRRMDGGLRTVLAVIVPAAVAMVVLARPLLALLGVMIGHPSATGTTATALAMLALGLPGFCTFLYVVRVLQSTQDLRSAFWLYVLENGLNIALALALVGPLGVRGIMLSISAAYTAAALAGLVHLRRRLGGLDVDRLWRPLARVGAASVPLLAGTVLGSSVSGSDSAGALLVRLGLGLGAGAAGFLAGAGVLAARHERRRSRPTPPPAVPPPAPPPPAGRPPRRPERLGPTRPPGGVDRPRGRLDPDARGQGGDRQRL